MASSNTWCSAGVFLLHYSMLSVIGFKDMNLVFMFIFFSLLRLPTNRTTPKQNLEKEGNLTHKKWLMLCRKGQEVGEGEGGKLCWEGQEAVIQMDGMCMGWFVIYQPPNYFFHL